jgi:hypothetical protein
MENLNSNEYLNLNNMNVKLNFNENQKPIIIKNEYKYKKISNIGDAYNGFNINILNEGLKWKDATKKINDMNPFNNLNQNWINLQNEYLQSLNIHDICVLNTWTDDGNNYINPYITYKETIELDTTNIIQLKNLLISKIKSTSIIIINNKKFDPIYLYFLIICKQKLYEITKETSNYDKYFILDYNINQYMEYIKYTNIKNKLLTYLFNNVLNFSEYTKYISYTNIEFNKGMSNETESKKITYYKTLLEFFKYIFNDKISHKNLYQTFLNYKISYYLVDDFLLEFVKMYTTDLLNIVNNAPTITDEMIVYRGIKSDYFLKYINNDNICYIPAFLSTTLALNDAVEYSDKTSKCCIKIIKLIIGTKCLLLDGISHMDVTEILLPYGSKFIKNNVGNFEEYIKIYNNMIKTIRFIVLD